MDKLYRAIEALVPWDEQERRDRELLLAAIDRLDTPLTRDNPFATSRLLPGSSTPPAHSR